MDKGKLRKFLFMKDKLDNPGMPKMELPKALNPVVDTVPKLPKLPKFAKTKNYFKK